MYYNVLSYPSKKQKQRYSHLPRRGASPAPFASPNLSGALRRPPSQPRAAPGARNGQRGGSTVAVQAWENQKTMGNTIGKWWFNKENHGKIMIWLGKPLENGDFTEKNNLWFP